MQDDYADQKYIADFCNRMRSAQDCHYASARLFSGVDSALVWASIVCTALVSTSLFTNLAQESPSAALVAGILTAAASIMLAVQRGLKYSDRSEKHRRAGSAYGALYEDLAQGRVKTTNTELDEIQKRKSALGQEAPLIPGFVRRHVLSQTARQST
jgi:hypothetical protein